MSKFREYLEGIKKENFNFNINHNIDMLNSISISIEGKSLGIKNSIESLIETIKNKKDNLFDKNLKNVEVNLIELKDLIKKASELLYRIENSK